MEATAKQAAISPQMLKRLKTVGWFVGIIVVGDDTVTLGPQLGKDALGVDQVLRAAEADKADSGFFAHG